MRNIARLYQNWPDPKTPLRKEGEFRYWSQNIGMSYFEYFRGIFYTPKQAEGLPHANCFQTPPPRSKHTMVNLASHIRFEGSGNTTMTPYFMVFGGYDGSPRSDVWLFINGLVNGSKFMDVELETPRKYSFIPRNLGSDSLAQSCEERETACNRCNRWHQVNAGVEARGLTDCYNFASEVDRSLHKDIAKQFRTEWCPFHYEKYEKLSKKIDMGHHDHATAVVYKELRNMHLGSMMSFGGKTKTKLSNKVWYLDHMPLPSIQVNDPLYKGAMKASWYCLRTYGANELYPPRPVCSSSEIVNETAGNLSSGKLLPQTSCAWNIKPHPSLLQHDQYIIVLDITMLDLDNPPYTCSSFIEVRDYEGNYSYSTSMNHSLPGEVIFFGCTQALMTSKRLASRNGGMLIRLVYEDDCPSHSGFDAQYSVKYLDDESLVCKTCSGHGECLAGVCKCNYGYNGVTCNKACSNPEECSALQEEETSLTRHYPTPRSGHTMVSAFAESKTFVVHRTYARTESVSVQATSAEVLSALEDIRIIYKQESTPPLPWKPKKSFKRTLKLQREIQSFQCTATKSPPPDAATGREQNQFPCLPAGNPTGRKDAVQIINSKNEKVCQSTWQFPDKFKLKFDCLSLKEEIDLQPQVKWGDTWLQSGLCTKSTEWIPQNALKEDIEAEFNRTFGMVIKADINLGYSATVLSGGGSEKVENMEWHDSVNFGGGCTGNGEIRCNPKTACQSDGDNSRSAVFCAANPGTDEFDRQCTCEVNPMHHYPEVCSKIGTNVVTITFEYVPECQNAGDEIPFCNLPEIFLFEKESDLTILFTSNIQATSDCAYQSRFCGCNCKKDGIAPYYVIMDGNKSREIFQNDITQVDFHSSRSQFEELNQTTIVQDSLFQVPIRVKKTKIVLHDMVESTNGTKIPLDTSRIVSETNSFTSVDVAAGRVKANKTITYVEADYYESRSTTRGEGASLIVFGGWTGNTGLNDLWVLNVQEQVGSNTPNRTCKTLVASDNNLVDIYSPDAIFLPYYSVSQGDMEYMPCSNLNSSAHSFFPNFHKFSKWRRIGPSITGTPPCKRFKHTAVKFGLSNELNHSSPTRYRMIIFGGYDTEEMVGLNDLWELQMPARTENNSVFRWTQINTTGNLPHRRWYHACTTLKRDIGNVFVVYGGWDGAEVLNDIWTVPLDRSYGETLAWTQLDTTRGVWHSNRFAALIPSDSLAVTPGFTHTDVIEPELPSRYGHTMVSVTTSFDGRGATLESLMSFSGSQTKLMPEGLNEDIYGWWNGGKETALYYICPDIDMSCSHPVYKAVGTQIHKMVHIVCAIGVVIVTCVLI